jgi:glycosyltransferase involved in cell wall biosynthesis
MLVTHLSFSDGLGGAAISAHRLHEGLRRLGVTSRMMVAEKSTCDEDVAAVVGSRTLGQRLRRRVRVEIIRRQFARYSTTRPAHLDAFSDDRAADPDVLLEMVRWGGIYHLHWVAGLLDYRSFFRSIPGNVPLVWTLHDLNPFTGGCHYTAGCDKFTIGCGACPALGSVDKFDLSDAIFRRKRIAYGRLQPEQVRVITPSGWLSREASRSVLFHRFEIATIPYGLNTEVFRPREQSVAREVFGIPQEMRIVMFAAQLRDNHRKGFDLLIAALDGLDVDRKVGLVSVGGGCPLGALDGKHFPLGELKSERLMSFAYSTADVFVSPTREDNLPNVLVEAMSCGVPTVAFDVGGVPDIVRPGVTGLLATAEDVRSLRHAIVTILSDNEKRESMSRASRRIALGEYGLELQAERYRQLYLQLLAATGQAVPVPSVSSNSSYGDSPSQSGVLRPHARDHRVQMSNIGARRIARSSSSYGRTFLPVSWV